MRNYEAETNWIFQEEWNRKVSFNSKNMKATIHLFPSQRVPLWTTLLAGFSMNAVGGSHDPQCLYDSSSGISFIYRDSKKRMSFISKIVFKQKAIMLSWRILREVKNLMKDEQLREQTAVRQVFDSWGISMDKKDYECYFMTRENIKAVKTLFDK